MGLINFSKVDNKVTHLPSRVRGAGSGEDKEATYNEFRQLIAMAAEGAAGLARVRIEGELACATVQNALQSMKKDHPMEWACLWTMDGEYDKSKTLSLTLCAAARPLDRKLAKVEAINKAREAGYTTAEIEDSGEYTPASVGVTVRKANERAVK